MKKTRHQFDDDYEYDFREGKKKIKLADSDHHKRRDIKNWTKAWSEHEDDYDEFDEFYGKSANTK